MAATIKSIADAVGVSRFSVSCALNGRDDQVSPETRARIITAARQLGYRPNAAARAARTGRFGAAAFIQRSGSSFFPRRLFEGVDEALRTHGMHLAVAHVAEDDLADTDRTPRLLRELCVDGLLVNQGRNVPGRLTEAVRQMSVPTIWLNAKQDVDAVYPDEAENTSRLTRQLQAMGHRRIALCRYRPVWRTDVDHYSHSDRIAGYVAAMGEAGLQPRTEIHDYRASADAAIWGAAQDDRLDRARGLLASPERPTAIIAPDMASAGPLLHAAATLGLGVPEDLTLVAIAHEQEFEAGVPLSTAMIPFDRVGAEAVDLLIRRIATPGSAQRAVAVPFADPVGGTIAPPKEH